MRPLVLPALKTVAQQRDQMYLNCIYSKSLVGLDLCSRALYKSFASGAEEVLVTFVKLTAKTDIYLYTPAQDSISIKTKKNKGTPLVALW